MYLLVGALVGTVAVLLAGLVSLVSVVNVTPFGALDTVGSGRAVVLVTPSEGASGVVSNTFSVV